MRKIICMNDHWHFTKEAIDPRTADPRLGEALQLPHTWNAVDGQDGGNDYYRGTCWYVKALELPVLGADEEAWLEFKGANMTAEVFLNGQLLGRHEGGYATFRVNLTPALGETNLLAVSVDNGPSKKVYPQKADFTFYGGIYRDVHLLILPKSHFALGCHGSPGMAVTPKLDHDTATVTVDLQTENTPEGTPVRIGIQGVAQVETTVKEGHAQGILTIPQVHRWDGLADPYLYTAVAELDGGGDRIQMRFGCRTFSFDREKGFFLNGRSYPLCGAARHQDRAGVGSALTREMQREDLSLMLEMGANTVRLAHYQHDQYFYELCDEAGMVVWAEIPYISEHMPAGNENTVSQMTDLVMQNRHHPSIVCWGLSNEITSSGTLSEDLIENHRRLNELCHKLDPTRPTTMAHVFMLSTSETQLVQLSDICSYNLYYGWYLGELEDNDRFFDDFHQKYPQRVIGLSEFGADANPQYQSPQPERGDYTESYQALYHEHMLKMWQARPYLWAMHVWNMFDFAADGRDEGGKHGVNQKGLVTFDRKLKKDAYYIYKAYLSKTPFVHLCGRRYGDRPEAVTQIKVYSNQPEVRLLVDGKPFASQKGEKVFCFDVPISGQHVIKAEAGEVTDSMSIQKTAQANPDYVLLGGQIINWFDREDMTLIDGHYSIKDRIADIKASPQGAALLAAMMEKAVAARGDVAKGVRIPEEMQRMMDRTPLEKMLRQIGDALSPEDIIALNRALSNIPKP